MTDRTVISFKERAGKPGGGKGLLVTFDKATTMACNNDQRICYENPRFAEWKETDKSGPVRVHSDVNGGGSAIVVETDRDE